MVSMWLRQVLRGSLLFCVIFFVRATFSYAEDYGVKQKLSDSSVVKQDDQKKTCDSTLEDGRCPLDHIKALEDKNSALDQQELALKEKQLLLEVANKKLDEQQQKLEEIEKKIALDIKKSSSHAYNEDEKQDESALENK